ncbi:hypothetical protein EAI_02125 [Harpegnathos saltator]|uniref:Uncharacterized protein n=1 Tax=Harpegnathos saltator TaxID=610380 RepID=E2BAC5_HARSA|nr:hypothetical protein EAI_02125 [Harpegnathos saltator]
MAWLGIMYAIILFEIRRVAHPEVDGDAVNKQYVDHSIKSLKDKQEDFYKKQQKLEQNLIKLHVNVHALREKIGKEL